MEMKNIQQTSHNYNLNACDQAEELDSLRGNYINRHINNEESLCVRVIRKKYKFIILLLATTYLFLEIINLFVTNLYRGEHAKTILLKFCQTINSTQKPNIHQHDEQFFDNGSYPEYEHNF